MGRPPCCDKSYVKKGAWTEEEDAKILAYVASHGACNWSLVPKIAGLQRCGKSCRLRWINYLRPDLKHESFTPEEEELIISLHAAFGSRWSLMAKKLPGHTDNEIKNYWNTKISKRLIQMRIDPVTHKPFSQLRADCQSMQLKYSTCPSCRNLTDGITCLNRDLKKDCTLNSEYNLPGPYLDTSSILVRPGQTQAMQLAAGSSQASFLGDQSSSSSFFFTNLYDNLHALVAPQLLSSQPVDHHMATPSSSSASSSTSYCWSDQFLLDEPFVPQNQDGPPLAFSSPKPSHDSLSPTSKDITMKHNLMKGDYGGTKNIMVASTSMFEDCSDKSFVDAMLQNHSKMLQQLPYYVFDPID